MARKQTKSAEAHPQIFSFTDREAMSVQLVGDFTHWKSEPINMLKRKGGVWSAKVNLPPGTYHYRFLVDGQWRDDPECSLRVPNPYAGEDCVRVAT